MERATIFQGVQLGLETTPGTLAAANRKLASMSIEPSITAEIQKFRPMGTKFPTLAALGKEWTVGKVSGQPTYTEIIYALSSIMKKVTPTGDGTAKTWLFEMNSSGADTVATYTIEQGDAVRAHRFTNGLFTTFGFTFSRSEGSLEGSILGRAIEDGITMTAEPTSIELVPVLPTQISLYLADEPDELDEATALARPLSFGWSLADRFGALWALNASQSSFATHVETEPKFGLRLTMEADTEGMGQLATMRASDTKFLRFRAEGDEIETGIKYLLQADTAVKIEDVGEFKDEDGVFAIDWNFAAVHDGGWGKAGLVKVINKLASL